MLPYLPNVDPSWLLSTKKIRSTARDLKEFLLQLMIVQVSCRELIYFQVTFQRVFIIQNHDKTVVQVGLAGWPPGPRRPVTTRRSGDPQLLKPSNLPRGIPASCVRGGVVQPTSISTPWKMNGWNLQINHLRKENDLNQTSMSMFHVNLQGCTFPPLLFQTKTNMLSQQQTS